MRVKYCPFCGAERDAFTILNPRRFEKAGEMVSECEVLCAGCNTLSVVVRYDVEDTNWTESKPDITRESYWLS